MNEAAIILSNIVVSGTHAAGRDLLLFADCNFGRQLPQPKAHTIVGNKFVLARDATMRIGPRHPRLAAAGYGLALPLLERYYRKRNIHRANSEFARAHIAAIGEKVARGETAYLAGVSAAGIHNSGIALIEVNRETGPRLLFNNEEERFSGVKHSNQYPRHSIEALRASIADIGLDVTRIDGWFSAWDYAALSATLIRTMLEEAPMAFFLLQGEQTGLFDMRAYDRGTRATRHIGQQLGINPPSLIGTPHHDNHAWFSYAASPFARTGKPVLVAVIDGLGDAGSISLYLCKNARMRLLYCNNSVFDSLGVFYSIISSTQGGWTWLSSEGRYMGAAAFGDNDRKSNKYYSALKSIFALQPEGRIQLNRDLANWHRSTARKPYTKALTRILGEPIAKEDMWNPDAMLRIEDIRHHNNTQERLDKAAATQMVFEDALNHVIGHFISDTGCDQLVLTGGTGLNAIGNMRLLEHFDANFFQREMNRSGRLHLWVPPTPNDSGVTIGAAYMGAYLAGYGVGEPVEHAFYCGAKPTESEIRASLKDRDDIEWVELVPITCDKVRKGYADFMAYLTMNDAIIAIYQGAAETGPRALGHRSILANPCNPATREHLNAKVKYREAIRPLAPMMTLSAAQRFFELSDGADDDDFNAYNYMVLTARAKPEAYTLIPAVIHVDGTGRLQIVREKTDPLTYEYLRALGRRIGVEVAVNTSFNVAGPIVQTPVQAIETLLRSRGLDALMMYSANGPVFAVLHPAATDKSGLGFRSLIADWESQSGIRLVA